jgi:hypothetical protein
LLLKEVIFYINDSLVCSLLYNEWIKAPMPRHFTLNVVIVPFFGKVDLKTLRLYVVEQLEKPVVVLIVNVVCVHLLHFVHHKGHCLNRLDDCFLLYVPGPPVVLECHLVLAAAKKDNCV